ncbi:MAG: hypothetical protein WDN06_23055 [Asticcacaulis sp.]
MVVSFAARLTVLAVRNPCGMKKQERLVPATGIEPLFASANKPQDIHGFDEMAVVPATGIEPPFASANEPQDIHGFDEMAVVPATGIEPVT